MTFYAMTLAYNHAHIVEEAIENFYKTANIPGRNYFVVDPHFPLNKPGQIKQIAKKYGLVYLSMPHNGGVAENWEWVKNTLSIEEDDILFGMDPDARIQSSGWMDDMLKVFEIDDVGYVFLRQPCADSVAREDTLNGVSIINYSSDVNFSVGAFHGRFLTKAGKMQQLHSHHGHFELWITFSLMQLKQRAVCINHYDHHLVREGSFGKWKDLCCMGKTQLSYSQWLKEESHADTKK